MTNYTLVFTILLFYFILGTKSDLTVGINIVQVEEGEKLQRKINANQFLECSAKNNDNINEVIYESIRAAVAGPLDPPPMGWNELLRKYLCCHEDN